MNSTFINHSIDTGRVGVKTQPATIRTPLFPFSSPNTDLQTSPKSYRSEKALQPQSPVGTDYRLPSLIYGQKLRSREGDNLDIETPPQPHRSTGQSQRNGRRRPRPGLQIITDFPSSQPQARKIVLNQVAAKHPEEGRNKARSIVSQRGVNVLPSPVTFRSSTQAISNLRDLIVRKRDKTKDVSKTTLNSNAKHNGPLTSRSSVVFGLRVPEYEAPLHGNGDTIQSAVTLVTPVTPQIVVTPADEDLNPMNKSIIARDTREPDSSSSSYSKPAYAIHRLPSANTIAEHMPEKRRHSSESQQQILLESSDSARPKSQGWWNLMMSPMLSRAGTLKTQKLRNSVVPPVPALPVDAEKTLPLQTPMTAMSPLTPRRLGLADARISTWSQWTDDKKELVDDELSDIETAVPVIPEEYLAHRSHNTAQQVLVNGIKSEGLAAEYYHACAVEQLTNMKYFECVNHSCADQLPKLQAIYDDGGEACLSKLIVTGDHNRQISRPQSTIGPDKFAVVWSGLAVEPGHEHVQMSVDYPKTISANGKDHPVSAIESEADFNAIVSPNVRQANMATFSKARTITSREPSPAPTQALPRVRSKEELKKTDVEAAPVMSHQPAVESPGPISPDATRTLAPAGAVPMAPLQSIPAEMSVPLVAPVPQTHHALLPPFQTQSQPTIVYYPYGQNGPYPFINAPPQAFPNVYHHNQDVTLQPSHNPASNVKEQDDSLHSHKDTKETQANRAIIDDHAEVTNVHGITMAETNQVNQALQNDGWNAEEMTEEELKKRKARNRFWTVLVAIVLIIVIILCILFAILFTRGSGNANPIDTQWLNLSGYPPVPTGVSTIARPNLVSNQNQCSQPSTLWSCSLPKEDQAGVRLNETNQPNLRFQIRFRNGTVPVNMTIPLNKRAQDPSADVLFDPNPTPPNPLEQVFLGKTTDNVSKPFDGESTPFFITFLGTNSGQALPSDKSRRLSKRQDSGSDLLNSIPAPAIGLDGTAAPATLLPTSPLPFSQPVKLYNRGQRDEHYGFYLYYDKSIFLSGIVLQNNSTNNVAAVADADQNGGSTKAAANVRCTWSQTRFIVKMYTNSVFGGTLLAGPVVNSTNSKQNKNSTTSATDFDRPGSFPYPTTVVLDRHGGDVNKKLLYCYGMQDGSIVTTQKTFVVENRALGGTLVNPSPKLIAQANSTFDSSLGGIDGGTGGCGCTWQNWA